MAWVCSLTSGHFVEHFDGEEAVGRLREFAEEVLAVFDFVGALLHGEEFRIDVRAVRYGRENFVPAGVFLAFPNVVEKARRAARRGHEPDGSVGARGGRRDGEVDEVLDEGGFVDDENVGGGADAGVGRVGDSEDLTAVVEF